MALIPYGRGAVSLAADVVAGPPVVVALFLFLLLFFFLLLLLLLLFGSDCTLRRFCGGSIFKSAGQET